MRSIICILRQFGVLVSHITDEFDTVLSKPLLDLGLYELKCDALVQKKKGKDNHLYRGILIISESNLVLLIIFL